MKKITIILLLVFACACAKKTPIAPPEQSGEGEIWKKYETISQMAGANPYRIQLSARLGSEGDTRRVTAILWGNSQDTRLDVTAGVGAILAKIVNTPQKFLLYTPRESKAYLHEGANKPLLRIGTPLPFNLGQLAALLDGNYASVFGHEYAAASPATSGDVAYELPDAPGGDLTLNASGIPTGWKKGPWSMSMSHNEGEAAPSVIRFQNANGKLAILRVKERETPERFTPNQLELKLPSGTTVLPFSQYKAGGD